MALMTRANGGRATPTDMANTEVGGAVVVQGDALPLLYRALLALAVRHRRDGITSPPLLHELRTALYRATMSPPRREACNALRSSACCGCQGANDWCTTGEAADLLRVSRRQVQRMAAEPRGGLEAIRIGGTWALRRSTVLALAQRRKAAR